MPEIEEKVVGPEAMVGHIVECIRADRHMSVEVGKVYKAVAYDERMFSERGGGLSIQSMGGSPFGFYIADRFRLAEK